jgi:hypothetical protein
MMHPVGPRPPAVYWRRRLALLAVVVVLVAISAWVLRPTGDKTQATSTATHPVSTPSPSPADQVVPPRSSPAPSSAPAATTTASRASQPAAPAACAASQLKVAAVVAQPNYAVGAQPVVLLQVTNSGPLPCVQNLADSQVELRVYNGESRVWGSHDCEIQPGTDDRTLAVGQAVRISETWSGLSSQPHCAGTRQRVGAGTYTLYALLSGHLGTAAQFSIS